LAGRLLSELISEVGTLYEQISTVHSMAVLSASDPPSSGAFHSDLAGSLDPVLDFLHQNGAPFMINPYPYFAYASDTRPETLAFCLFQPNAGRVDAGSKIKYTNMFDAQLDAVKSAMVRAGYGNVDIVVAETGWPTRGDAGEPGASVENARAYVSNLVAHLRSGAGTPLMPGKPVETYLFALYDEDLKPGKGSERYFGLFQTSLTETYPTGLVRNGTAGLGPGMAPAQAPTAVQPAPALPKPGQQPQVGVTLQYKLLVFRSLANFRVLIERYRCCR